MRTSSKRTPCPVRSSSLSSSSSSVEDEHEGRAGEDCYGDIYIPLKDESSSSSRSTSADRRPYCRRLRRRGCNRMERDELLLDNMESLMSYLTVNNDDDDSNAAADDDDQEEDDDGSASQQQTPSPKDTAAEDTSQLFSLPFQSDIELTFQLDRDRRNCDPKLKELVTDIERLLRLVHNAERSSHYN